jgi:ABC-2 type transport system permease protein
MIFLTLLLSTFREAFAKKIFIGFFAISSFVILLFLLFVNLDSVEGTVNMMESSGKEGIKQVLIGIEVLMLSLSYIPIITFCYISVSSFIPSMLEKGNIDLLLSKPVSRTEIILAKFIGGVLFIFLSLTYLIGSIWLILSLKSGYWHFEFLYSIFWFSLSFSVIYSLIILIGLLSQSTILSIIVSFFITIFCGILASRESTIFSFVDSDSIKFIINFIYYILPKPTDINSIAMNMITGEPIKSYMPVYSSVLFMIVALSVSVFYFKEKDY